MKKIIYIFLLLPFFLSNISAQSLYDQQTLRDIYIEFENPDWHSILAESWTNQTGLREEATLMVDGVTYEDVAIRYKGNATFFLANQQDNPKLPLNIDMDDINPNQDLLGFNKIKLANSFFDPTILRDVLGFQIYREYVPAPEANWMKVHIDSQYIGLYPNTESINKQFLNKHFDYKNGVLFKCDPASQFGSNDVWESPDLAWYGSDSTTYYNSYDLKSDHGWGELLGLIDILNNSPDELPNVLNIDRALWYLAVSTAIANYDSYNGLYIHNYYLYKHENGLFQFLPWDVSEAFVGILLINDFFTAEQLYEWDIFLENDPTGENRALLNYISSHPLYRKQFTAHIRTVRDEILEGDYLQNSIDEMQPVISDAANADNNYFFEIGNWFFESNVNTDVNIFGINVAGILSAAEKRKEYLNNHPEINYIPPSISEVAHSPENPFNGDEVTITALIENATQVDLMVTKNKYASHFQAIEMFDDGQHNDGIAGDNIYGATVPFFDGGDEIKYYIRAQNDDAMMLDPQRAEYEFHEYTVDGMVGIFENKNNLPALDISPNPSNGLCYLNTNNHLINSRF